MEEKVLIGSIQQVLRDSFPLARITASPLIGNPDQHTTSINCSVGRVAMAVILSHGIFRFANVWEREWPFAERSADFRFLDERCHQALVRAMEDFRSRLAKK